MVFPAMSSAALFGISLFSGLKSQVSQGTFFLLNWPLRLVVWCTLRAQNQETTNVGSGCQTTTLAGRSR